MGFMNQQTSLVGPTWPPGTYHEKIPMASRYIAMASSAASREACQSLAIGKPSEKTTRKIWENRGTNVGKPGKPIDHIENLGKKYGKT